MEEEHREAIELYPIASVYCTGVQHIDIVDDTAHITFYLTQPDGTGGVQDVVAAKIILPIEALADGMNLTRVAIETAVNSKLRRGKGRLNA